LPRYTRTFVRGAFIGFWMGFKPGRRDPRVVHELRLREALLEAPGAASARASSRGVVAPETAAHAAGVAAMLPMITLGIPGSPTAGRHAREV
jgi:putative tricarboxylic transport membrane protein